MDEKYIKLALEEDLANGDATTDSIFTEQMASANLICKQDGIIAGICVFNKTFELVDRQVQIKWLVSDGDAICKGQQLATINGFARSILHAERVALNYLQRMSGVASLTNQYVKQLANTDTKLYDTRKTSPNMRVFEKAAVKIGGGENHRFSLSDLIMIKDNHIKAAGSIAAAVTLAKTAHPQLQIEVECETLEQVKLALATKQVDIIMLDNMDNETIRQAVELIGNEVITEASGNMDIERIAQVAKCGVDRISVGALTHSYSSLDISLKM